MDLLCKCDVLCLCETWLRPGELECIKQVVNRHHKLSDMKFNVFAKSSMEECPGSFLGRPFGGSAIIARSRDNLYFKEIEYDCDRIDLISVNNDENNLIAVICNFYMPFYDPGNQNNTLLFSDTTSRNVVGDGKI